MRGFTRWLAEMCERCALCRYAWKNPDTWLGKFMAWHGAWCPAWRAHQQVYGERQDRSA